jgi:hypothetical protein
LYHITPYLIKIINEIKKNKKKKPLYISNLIIYLSNIKVCDKMSYYKTTNIVNKEIKRVMEQVREGLSVSVDLLVINLTDRYEIGELYIRKRIKLVTDNSERTGKKIIVDSLGVLKCPA